MATVMAMEFLKRKKENSRSEKRIVIYEEKRCTKVDNGTPFLFLQMKCV